MADQDEPKTPGERLRWARQRRRMKQIPVAEAAHIGQPTLSDIERGATIDLSASTLVSLCGVLRIRPQWVMTGRGDWELRSPSDLDLKPHEHAFLQKYRDGSAKWRAALHQLTELDEAQQEWVMENVLANVYSSGGAPQAEEPERVMRFRRPSSAKKKRA